MAASSVPLPRSGTLDDESRARDLRAFAVAARRRFWSTILIAGVLVAGLRLGLADVSPYLVGATFAVALALNGVLAAVGSRPSMHRPWLPYGFALVDTALLSSVVALFGAPVLVVAYILAILPYALDRGPTLGYATTAASVVGFVTAMGVYADARPPGAVSWPQVALAAGLLVVVAQQVIQIPARLMQRLRRTRERLALVERGDLSARADARHADDLGFLERSLNGLVEEFGHVIDAVRRDADDLATVAAQMQAAATTLQQQAAQVASGSEELRDVLHRQYEQAAVGARTGQEAQQTAEAARRTAEVTATEARALDDMAVASREAIDRAARTLLQVGYTVTEAATQVRALAPASEQIGHFVDAISRMAKQTNLLALNAAIEASRAGEDGLGFAVVADEIRALAVESAHAARQVTRTVQRVRDDIGAAVLAMDATADDVDGAESIARDATRALATMVDGIGRVSRRSDDVAALAQTQSQLAAAAAAAFGAIDSAAHQAATARLAAGGAAAHQASLEALSRSAAQLTLTASRLRALASRRTGNAAA
jgi:methyl-accepting chemotaxis protein